jgi:methyl-accepting chemotaxis protein
MSKQQAQAQVLAIVNKMRYNKGLGYYFIFNRDKPYPKMVIEPMFPELNGKVLDDKKFNNASGSDKNLFLAASDLLVGNKETFIDYIWPRPDDKDSVDIAKFSYLRVYEDWDWVIGTGIYLDDAVKDCIKKSISDLREMRYANGTGYFWINDNTKPTPRLIMNPFLTELEGQILTDKKYNRAYGEDYNLYEAFLDACEETGDGFVDYSWDKPYNGSIIEDAPKISYVKYFKPLGWVIGSGVYVDDIDRAINTKTQKMNEQRKRLIVNYLLISLTLAVLSIGILVFLMNRYFKNIDKKNETVEDISETIPQNELQATTKNENPEIAATSTNGDKTDETPISEMGHLIGLILREQTKQLAMSRMADQELKEKTEAELKVMINEIKSILQNAKNGSSAT